MVCIGFCSLDASVASKLFCVSKGVILAVEKRLTSPLIEPSEPYLSWRLIAIWQEINFFAKNITNRYFSAYLHLEKKMFHQIYSIRAYFALDSQEMIVQKTKTRQRWSLKILIVIVFLTPVTPKSILAVSIQIVLESMQQHLGPWVMNRIASSNANRAV